MHPVERLRIFDVPVDAVTMDTALAEVDRIVKGEERGGYILAVNPEKVDVLEHDPFLNEMFEGASLLLPDGIGVVMAVRLLYGRAIGRVPGADLMQNLCRVAPQKGYKIFIYGAKEEVNAGACAILQERHPGIRIVGRANGYVSESEMPQLVEAINASEADILFIALGSPRQERWIQQYLPNLNVKVCQGIGGTLDTITGNVKRAPIIFQRLNLEWFYRLFKEPKRWRRQMVLPKFAWMVVKQRFSGNNAKAH